jgi:glycosyltransferase involved in cell wall biosynthesis
MNKKPLSIFLLNCDWRDMFDTSHEEFKDKLQRDQLGGDINSFFVFSWARTSYLKTRGNCTSLHKKTFLDTFRPLLDLWTIPAVLLHVMRSGVKYNVWICYDFGFVPALWLAQKIWGGKLVMCLNNQPRIYSKTRRFGTVKFIYSWLVEKLFSSLVGHFFTINQTMKDYVKALGVSESKISVFSMNTIERDSTYIEKAQKGIIRKKYGIPDSHKIILTVARLEAEKNYPKLLELFAGLGEGYTLIALGRGSMLEQLRKQAQVLGISERVFFPGFVHREEIWNYYADADVFVLISKAEALGVVFWEAMYMNVPIVGSDVEGIVETIGHDGDKGRIWKDEMGQEGFNEIIGTIDSQQDMIKRAKVYVGEKISNRSIINDIV